jgi:hypothetical protein
MFWTLKEKIKKKITNFRKILAGFKNKPYLCTAFKEKRF